MYPGSVAESHPDKIAYVIAETGDTVTYRGLHDEACRVAQLLRSLGLKAGDHVALCMENHPKFFPVVWGAHYAGLYYTAVSSRLTAPEVEYIVNDCGAEAFFTSSKLQAVSTEIISSTPNVRLRLCVDGPYEGHGDYAAAISEFPAELIDDASEGRDMLYSSGTTGRPKGVKTPLANAKLGTPDAIATLCTLLFGVTDETVYLSPAPLYHAAPLRFSMAVQRYGGTVVQMQRFDPNAALELIETHRVNFTQMVPTMFVRLLKLPKADRSRHDLSSLQVVVHAAAPCPVEVKEQMIQWWGPIIHEYYAGTEGNGFCYANSEDWLAHKGTVGKSLLGPIHILDENLDEVERGIPGAVYFEAAAPFKYHNDEEKTAASYESHGWSTLGDIGYLDDDDFLYLTDRSAYMIISGGVNIYPQEAENILTMHPAVFDVAVFGIPDEDLGETVLAVVQPADESQAGPELAAKLIAYCHEHLAKSKCPRRVDFRDDLPRHPTGKLYKRLLKDEYLAAHAAEDRPLQSRHEQ